MELAHLPYKKGRTYEQYLGKAGLKRFGKRRWRAHVNDVTARLQAATQTDYAVIGGGNAKLLRRVPRHTRRGTNRNAFAGGRRLWGA